MPPVNPFYRRDYCTTVKGGQAWVGIPAPGDVVEREDAEHLIELLHLIIKRLERDINNIQTKGNDDE